MSFLFQIIFVALAFYTIACAPGGLLKWLAATAALQFALILSFSTDISTGLAMFGLGGGALVLFINAIITMQDNPDMLTLRLIAPVFPLIILWVFLGAMMAIMVYDAGTERLSVPELLLPYVAPFAVVPLMWGAMYTLRRYIAFVWRDLVFLVVTGVGIAIALPDVFEYVPLLALIFVCGICMIVMMLQAKSNPRIRRAAIACFILGLASGFTGMIELESLRPVILTLFGGAVALTCLAVILYKATDAPPTPRGPESGAPHLVGFPK